MTSALKDETRKLLILKTLHKEVTLHAINEAEFERMCEKIMEHSLGNDFNEQYGIKNYIGSSKLGRLYLVENREDFSTRLAFIVPFEKILENHNINRSTFYLLIEKFSSEICKSFEIQPYGGLILISKVFTAQGSMVFLYDHNQYAIPLESIMNFEDMKSDDAISVVMAASETLTHLYPQCDKFLQEVHPKNIILTRDKERDCVRMSLILSFLPSATKEYLEFVDNHLYFNPMLHQSLDQTISEIPFLLTYTYTLFALLFKLLGGIDVFGNPEDFLFDDDEAVNTKNVAQRIIAKLSQLANKYTRSGKLITHFKELLITFSTAGEESLAKFIDLLNKLTTEHGDDTSYDAIPKEDSSDHEK